MKYSPIKHDVSKYRFALPNNIWTRNLIIWMTEFATQAFGRPLYFVPMTYMPYDKFLRTAGFMAVHFLPLC